MSEYRIPTPEERRRQREADAGENKSNKVMRVLLLINFFGWNGDWAWTRYVVGVVLVIYGIWRAYRQVKGID